MKRYVVFAGRTYEPNGGALDLHSDHSTLVRAKIAASSAMDAIKNERSWAHILDTQTQRIVVEMNSRVLKDG